MGHPEIDLARKDAESALITGIQKESEFISDYVSDYTYEGDNGYYSPNFFEKSLIEDAIRGLVSDNEFIKLLVNVHQNELFLEGLPR